MAKQKLKMACSFCKSTAEEVTLLISSPDTGICNACVQICVEIIFDKLSAKRPVRLVRVTMEKIVNQDEIDAFVKQYRQ